MILQLLLLVLVECHGAWGYHFKLVILHNSNLYSRFKETQLSGSMCTAQTERDCAGGFPRISEAIRNEKRYDTETRKTVYMFAGGILRGSSWYQTGKEKICADFMNILKPDVMSFGFEDFREGPTRIIDFLKILKTPVTVSNVDLSQTPELARSGLIKPHVVLQVAKWKVGVIGYVDTKLNGRAHFNMTIKDEVASIDEQSRRLKAQGVDIIIAMGTASHEMEMSIAEQAADVDVVVGGASRLAYNGKTAPVGVPEGPYPEMVPQKGGRRVPLVQVEQFGIYMGRLEVTFDEHGDVVQAKGQPVFLSHDKPQDDECLRLLKKWEPQVQALSEQVLCQSYAYMEADVCCTDECNLGNLITDAMVAYQLQRGPPPPFYKWTQAAVALMPCDSITDSIDTENFADNVTFGHVMESVQFDDNIVRCKISGYDLLRALEHSATGRTDLGGGMLLQVSGLHVQYDANAPPYHRVIAVQIRCAACLVPQYQEIDGSRSYSILSSEYMLSGLSGYTMFDDCYRNREELGITAIQLLTWYFKKTKLVLPEEENRITIIRGEAATDTADLPFVCLPGVVFSVTVAFLIIVA